MTFENRLGEDELFYPASLEMVVQENGKRLYFGFKIDGESGRILDCRWNDLGFESMNEKFESFSVQIVGHFAAELSARFDAFFRPDFAWPLSDFPIF